MGANMSEADNASGKGERIDHERREAVLRLAKYTAPAMLAVLVSQANATGQPVIVVSGIRRD
jgi:hypothetical protein